MPQPGPSRAADGLPPKSAAAQASREPRASTGLCGRLGGTRQAAKLVRPAPRGEQSGCCGGEPLFPPIGRRGGTGYGKRDFPVDLSRYVPSFGRYEFFLRRLHSLTGLIPVGGYLAFHLLTNASILDGPEAFAYRVEQIHRLGPTTLLLLEWPFIFLPILFHGVVGMLIVMRGKRNVANYPYAGNIRYTFQRATGVIAFVFILYHVFQMHGWLRFDWWKEYVAGPMGGAQFQAEDPLSAARALQGSWLVQAIYGVGVLACVYHFANGVWTMGITWGVWTGLNAQRWANIPAILLGVFLGVVGLGALWGMATVDTTPPPVQAGPAASTSQGVSQERDRPDELLGFPPPRSGALARSPSGSSTPVPRVNP